MIQASVEIQRNGSVDALQGAFVAMLPKIQEIARWRFRFVRCRDRKNDCISETVALCWLWHRRLAATGRDSRHFVWKLTVLAARAVSCGRRLCGQDPVNDVLSPVCQRRRGFSVGSLSSQRLAEFGSLREALHENTRTEVPDQVQFRIDFPDWLATLDNRRRRVLRELAAGYSTGETAAKFGISSGRVSQLRREFFEGYTAFCSERASSTGNISLNQPEVTCIAS